MLAATTAPDDLRNSRLFIDSYPSPPSMPIKGTARRWALDKNKDRETGEQSFSAQAPGTGEPLILVIPETA
jgi:hypothetical protein